MISEKGWWLALPYFGESAHVMRILERPLYPPAGPRVFTAAYLGSSWTSFHDPAGLLSRCVDRLLPGAKLALFWKPVDTGPKRETVVHELVASGFVCHEDDDVGDGFIFQLFEVGTERVGLNRAWRKPNKAALVMRFGAYGDHLMAASVLPALKADGWHVTYLGPQEAFDVLKHDPHIDRLLFHPREAVGENLRLIEYMEAWGSRFDRVINLNATVERALLYRPDQHEFHREDAARRRLCDYNYLDYIHHTAGVAPGPRQRFYPSHQEADRAAAFVAKHKPVAVVCLSGSAEHKIWPHLPEAIVRLLSETPLTICLSGGERDIEMAKEARANVVRWLGKGVADRLHDLTRWPIRETMALACQAQVMIGPETGVMNAAAFEPAVGKVLLLSHSTVTNLTRDWPRTISLAGKVPCYPCHRLHETLKYCPRGPLTKRAACAEAIPPSGVVDAVKQILAEPVERAEVEEWRQGSARASRA